MMWYVRTKTQNMVALRLRARVQLLSLEKSYITATLIEPAGKFYS